MIICPIMLTKKKEKNNLSDDSYRNFRRVALACARFSDNSRKRRLSSAYLTSISRYSRYLRKIVAVSQGIAAPRRPPPPPPPSPIYEKSNENRRHDAFRGFHFGLSTRARNDASRPGCSVINISYERHLCFAQLRRRHRIHRDIFIMQNATEEPGEFSSCASS